MYDDDIRRPGPELTEGERDALAVDFGAMLLRSAMLAVAAVAIGVGSSAWLAPPAPATVAASAQAPD